RNKTVLVNVHYVVAKLHGFGILGNVFKHIVIVGHLHQLVDVGIEAAAADVFVKIIGADKAGAFVAGGNAFNQVERGQVEPAVVVAIEFFMHHKDHFVDVGRAVEIDIKLLFTQIGVASEVIIGGKISAQDGETALALASLIVADQHLHLGAAIRPQVIGG